MNERHDNTRRQCSACGYKLDNGHDKVIDGEIYCGPCYKTRLADQKEYEARMLRQAKSQEDEPEAAS